MASTLPLYDVRLVWHSGHEANITLRAHSTKEARKKAREFALNSTAIVPSRMFVRKLHVLR